MAEQLFVQTKGAYLLPSGETINPGSIIQLDEETARQFVDRGLGTFSDGPVSGPPATPAATATRPTGPRSSTGRSVTSRATATAEDQPDVQGGRPPRGRVAGADLGERLARAEHAVARPQQ